LRRVNTPLRLEKGVFIFNRRPKYYPEFNLQLSAVAAATTAVTTATATVLTYARRLCSLYTQ